MLNRRIEPEELRQHRSLSLERWAGFGRDQQILMIANEMNRATRFLTVQDGAPRTNCYERVLRLTDLTIQTQPARGFRRELLRWRDLVAELYISPEPDPAAHRSALRCLLQFTPEAARQIPWIAP